MYFICFPVNIELTVFYFTSRMDNISVGDNVRRKSPTILRGELRVTEISQ